MDRLGALDADIRMVTQRLARVTNNNVPLLPDGLQRAMLCNKRSDTGNGSSRKRKSCDLDNAALEIGGRGRSTALMEPASGPIEQPGNVPLPGFMRFLLSLGQLGYSLNVWDLSRLVVH